MSEPFAGADAPPGSRPAGSPSETLVLSEPGQAGEARRFAGALAARLGLGDSERSDFGILVTELATNAIRHAEGGQLVFRPLAGGAASGIEVLCLDRGPGMANLAECLRDGFSTAGTMGTGLGAVKRLAHEFDAYSAPGRGTVMLARLWPRAQGAVPAVPFLTGAVCLPVAGETACGDAWATATDGARTLVLVVDGLGHGPLAADAAQAAVRLFAQHAAASPAEIIDVLHRGLRSTRGAAAAVAEIDASRRRVRFAGLGNIGAAVVSDGGSRSMISHNGTVGHQARSIQMFEYPWTPEAALVMHSDGLQSHWRIDRYPGLLRRDPAVIAGVLYRDFIRGRDDTTVVVCRSPASERPDARASSVT